MIKRDGEGVRGEIGKSMMEGCFRRENKRDEEGQKTGEGEHMSMSPPSLLPGSWNLCSPVNHVKI